MHNHVIVNKFEDLMESMKEFELKMREGFKETKLVLKEEMQECGRDIKIWKRWMLGTYLGAVCCRETPSSISPY